jgi:hypothetical protein
MEWPRTVKKGYIESIEADTFGAVRMRTARGITGHTRLTGTDSSTTSSLPAMRLNLVGVTLDGLDAPNPYTIIRTSLKKFRIGGTNVIATGGIAGTIRVGGSLDIYARGGDVTGGIVAAGAIGTLESRSLAVRVNRTPMVFGGTIAANVYGGSSDWLTTNPAYMGAGNPAIGSIFGSQSVTILCVAGYSDATALLPTYGSGLLSVGTLETGSIAGAAYLSPLAATPVFLGDTDAMNDTFVVYTAP